MKRIILILVIVFFVGNTFAQNISQNNIPAVVLNSFQLQFPNAEDVSWKLVEGNYHIKFELNGKFNELYLNYKGEFLKYHQDLWGSEVPERVINTIKSKVKFFDLNDADLIKEENETYYEINFELDGEDHDFWIDEAGKLLKYRRELKDSKIPSSIINLINTKYGKLDIDRTRYVEENGKIVYIIEGEINDMDHVFTVDNKAIVVKHEQDLRDNEIPNPIKNTLTQSYKDYDIRDADIIEVDGKTSYILRLRKSKKQIYVTFNKTGKVLEVR